MTSNPRIAAGLSATRAALVARSGQMRDNVRYELLRDVMIHAPDDAGLRAAVLTFCEAKDCATAGGALLSYLASNHVTPSLQTQEGVQDLAKAHGIEFDWQKRADLQ